jgi:hypothetical protein
MPMMLIDGRAHCGSWRSTEIGGLPANLHTVCIKASIKCHRSSKRSIDKRKGRSGNTDKCASECGIPGFYRLCLTIVVTSYQGFGKQCNELLLIATQVWIYVNYLGQHVALVSVTVTLPPTITEEVHASV